MKKYVGLCFFLLLVACSNNNFNEEMYQDTMQLMSEMVYSFNNDVEIEEDRLQLFTKYDEKYSDDLNASEQEVIELLSEMRSIYDNQYGSGAVLVSELTSERTFEDVHVELFDLLQEIKDDNGF